MQKKLSTIFAIAGALCYTAALWFMYRETCRYYEENYNIVPEEKEPEPEKPINKKDAAATTEKTE